MQFVVTNMHIRVYEMIIEGLAIATATACGMYYADKSSQMDEKALKKYAKAFEKDQEARMLVEEKAEYTDKRLMNVARKKRAIFQVTIPKFVAVYEKIQKVEVVNNQTPIEYSLKSLNNMKDNFGITTVAIKQDFTDKELVCGLLKNGLGKMMIKDSERYQSAANSQMRASNVAYEQAVSIGEAYDAIVARADRIAKVLVMMNSLFISSIQETDRIIKQNGLDVHNYSEMEKGVLMNCVNLACAMSDIINVPVVDEQGKICQEACKMIEKGEQYINKMQQVMAQ